MEPAAARPVTAIAPGATVDGFTVGRLLASGGVGRLYEVERADAAFPLVMKVPHIGASGPTEALIGFETECMILPALQTLHAPRFVASGPIDEVPYLVMERVPGESVAGFLREGGLPPDEAARLGAALARAASALHRQDVIHLDIKPDNAILRPTGEVTLLDFGFSHHASFPDLFAEGSRQGVGSWPYISPEQLDGVRTDARSDQFAIGASVYELLTGTLPWEAPQTLAMARNRGWVVPAAPRALNPAVTPHLQEIVLRCLEPDPQARFPSCAHLADAFLAPQSVPLTARAQRLETPGLFGQMVRFLRRPKKKDRPAAASPRGQIDQAPLICVAVDTDLQDPPLLEALRRAAQRALVRSAHSRLACVTVITDGDEDEAARHREYWIRLSHWARPFGLPDHRQSLHVFQTPDPAAAILEFAAVNQVDALILGASHQAPGPKVSLSRTVMTRVAEDAPCSVHIIRA